MQFIHTADIHLDSPLRGLEQYEGAPVEEIRGATRRALENLVQLAIDREVDFVLIAGDLYDGDWQDYNTGLFFVHQMQRLREADIPVFMISGNHDAANRMTKSLRLPDTVTLLDHRKPETARSHHLTELGVAIHGQSFAKAKEFDNLASAYPEAVPGMFNIGLLHTSLQGYEGHEPYAPCSLDDLRQKGYHYWALGHVHRRTEVCEEPWIVFPGNIQGRHIREAGAKGCYVVSVDDRQHCELEFVPLDVFRWEVCWIDASAVARPVDIVDSFLAGLDRLIQRHEGLPLAVRVEVRGATQAHEAFLSDALRWTNELRAAALQIPDARVWVEKILWQTHPKRDLTDVDPSDPVGVLLEYLREAREDEAELQQLAASLDDLRQKLPNELLNGGDALRFDVPEQLRQWLNEAEALLWRRLHNAVS